MAKTIKTRDELLNLTKVELLTEASACGHSKAIATRFRKEDLVAALLEDTGDLLEVAPEYVLAALERAGRLPKSDPSAVSAAAAAIREGQETARRNAERRNAEQHEHHNPTTFYDDLDDDAPSGEATPVTKTRQLSTEAVSVFFRVLRRTRFAGERKLLAGRCGTRERHERGEVMGAQANADRFAGLVVTYRGKACRNKVYVYGTADVPVSEIVAAVRAAMVAARYEGAEVVVPSGILVPIDAE